MTDNAVLGIHSQIHPDTQGSFQQFVDGHAWISVSHGGETRHYGLWPDGHREVPDNGDETDIREGIEAGSIPSASRYFELPLSRWNAWTGR